MHHLNTNNNNNKNFNNLVGDAIAPEPISSGGIGGDSNEVNSGTINNQ